MDVLSIIVLTCLYSITANPAFEDIGREDSGIENDDEITVNRAALEFDDS